MTRMSKETTIQYLTQEELQRLFGKIHDKRDRALFDLVYKHGLRASEVGLLRRDDVDLERGQIRIHRVKGGNSGTFPLFRDSIRILKAYLATRADFSPTLFPSKKKNPISRKRIFALFEEYARKAKLPDEKRHPHVLRHSIATHLLESGQNMEMVQDWLGHTYITSTQIYGKITDRRRSEAHREAERSIAVVKN